MAKKVRSQKERVLVSFEAPLGLRRQLQRHADRQRRSLSGVIREALRLYLKRQEHKATGHEGGQL